MNALKLIIQAGCLIFLAVIALILARQSHADKPAPPSPQPSARWSYAQFEFIGPRIEELGRKLNASLVYYDFTNSQSLDAAPTRTNRVIGADQLLGEISRDGWQFVWTNGTNFLTRRAEGEGRHAYFEVEYLPETQ